MGTDISLFPKKYNIKLVPFKRIFGWFRAFLESYSGFASHKNYCKNIHHNECNYILRKNELKIIESDKNSKPEVANFLESELGNNIAGKRVEQGELSSHRGWATHG